ncbi:hypothetical protein [Scatolibacter rhodanostii]|uniref:hypothetical protein n=1 Tax=Scatolibacter rhodanostii TaxID=2014781 RepID=UPI000C06AC31|nr:hypothetical protein [Scatolibacter rhodanostii]
MSEKSEKKATFASKLNVLSSAESKVMRNDFAHIWNSKGMRFMLIFLPIVMAALIPVAFFLIIMLSDVNTQATVPSTLKALLSSSVDLDYRQTMSHAFVTLICPIFYLSIPIIASIAAASSTFVTDAENGTLETLMLSSASPREIFNAKVSGSVLISIVISLISFVIFSVTASIGNVLLWTPFFFTPNWLLLVLGIMPALSVLCVIFVTLKLTKIHSVKESLKTMGYFILIIAIFYILQMAGVYVISLQLLLAITLLLFVADIVLFNLAWRRFTPEEQLLKEFELSNTKK